MSITPKPVTEDEEFTVECSSSDAEPPSVYDYSKLYIYVLYIVIVIVSYIYAGLGVSSMIR